MTRAPHPGKGAPATPRRTVFFAALCFLLVPAVSRAVEPNLAAAVAEAADGRVYSVGLCDGEQSVSIDITPASRCHNSYSTAKLFTAAAVGLLVDRAELSIDEPIYPILAPYFPETFDPRWKEVTVEHLLTHFVGFGEDFRDIDIDSEDPRSWGTDDYLGRAVSNDLVYPPGEKEVHSDAAFYLLSRVVAVRAGKGLDDFLRDEFFVPMRFAEYAFSRCPHGYALGATGIYLSAEDMAKFGAMYAAGGVYRGRRCLSEEYVRRSIQRHYALYPIGEDGFRFQKGGMNGQVIYINTRTGLAAAIQSFGGDLGDIEKILLEHDR